MPSPDLHAPQTSLGPLLLLPLNHVLPHCTAWQVLYETKANWKKGESKLTPEQYNALARKIRGTYKDYFKVGSWSLS